MRAVFEEAKRTAQGGDLRAACQRVTWAVEMKGWMGLLVLLFLFVLVFCVVL